MAQSNNSVFLTEGFLYALYLKAMNNDYITHVVAEYIEPEELPDRDFQIMHKALKAYYKKNRKHPKEEILKQAVSANKGAMALIDEIAVEAADQTVDDLLSQLENYIRQTKFQKAFREIGDMFNRGGIEGAIKRLDKYYDWLNNFGIVTTEFVDVASVFRTRFMANRERHNSNDGKRPVTRFYIDELDARNGDRDLRGQLTCFLAPSGVGKSHIARWIGKNAYQIDGLNVLHIQLEGSEDEVINAYAASLIQCNTFKYETGTVRDSEIDRVEQLLSSYKGHIHIKSYPKFNCNVSTVDVNNAIQTYKKRFGAAPDIVIIDSMDLLSDSTGQAYSDKGERLKRIKVANDLKDIAGDEQIWMVVTYQSTIENQDWLNDEKNVLTAYNTSEAKGLCRPLTHLITLNQSAREDKENIMRLFIAKSRFFKKGEAFRIATDYEHEMFYSRERTMSIAKMI